jgi:hypothetical protein
MNTLKNVKNLFTILFRLFTCNHISFIFIFLSKIEKQNILHRFCHQTTHI